MSVDDVIKKYSQLSEEKKREVDLLLEKLSSEKVEQSGKIPGFGVLKGKIKFTDEFDEPIDDFKEYTG